MHWMRVDEMSRVAVRPLTARNRAAPPIGSIAIPS